MEADIHTSGDKIMNTLFKQDRMFQQIEECLKVLAAVIIAATPVYALWALNTMSTVSPV